jgi:putative spermidine/putrescine transport system substrate-binding protein
MEDPVGCRLAAKTARPRRVMQVAQGEADIAGIFYSKSVYPYTVQGAPVDMCYPREGAFAGINTLTLVKNGPERELAIAFINWMLDPGCSSCSPKQP